MFKIFIIFIGSVIGLSYAEVSANEKHLEYLRFASQVYSPNSPDPFRNVRTGFPDKQELNDILGSPDENKTLPLFLSNRFKRKIVNEIDPYTKQPTRWPNGIVAYELDKNFPETMRVKLQKAIDHWESKTCLKFEVYNPARHPTHRSFIGFIYSTVCSSFVGYLLKSYSYIYKSPVYLADYCGFGSIVHELGHSIGFRHEQSRYDRDDHIIINWDQIGRDPSSRFQYSKMTDGQPYYYNQLYDLSSIMHYGGPNDKTLSAIDPNRQFLMGQRDGLSFLDISLANAAYKCSANCPPLNCQNNGFQDKNCNCVCPDGLTGRLCESIITSLINFKPEINIQIGYSNQLNCNFDGETLCMWAIDKARGVLDWTLNKGYTESYITFGSKYPGFKTGPQRGDRYGNMYGTYVYINSYRKYAPNANAVLMSPKIRTDFPVTGCLKFWYQMYQTTAWTGLSLKVGNLSVVLRYSNGIQNRVWFRDGNNGEDWQSASVDVTIQPPVSAIFFEGYLNGISYGDISIDEIQFTKGTCNQFRAKDSVWSTWSECSVSCGEGIQTRKTQCYNPPCANVQIESQKCVQQKCREPEWTEWTEWSECTKTCDSFKYRVRLCKNSDKGKCIGEPIEYQPCASEINCETSDENSNDDSAKRRRRSVDDIINKENLWTPWSDWTDCEKVNEDYVCSEYFQKRTRTCIADSCKGDSSEERICEIPKSIDVEQLCKSQPTIGLGYECKYRANDKSIAQPEMNCKISDKYSLVSSELSNLRKSNYFIYSLNPDDRTFGSFIINVANSSDRIIDLEMSTYTNDSSQSNQLCLNMFLMNTKLNDDAISLSYFDFNQEKYVKINSLNIINHEDDNLKEISADILNEKDKLDKIKIMLEINVNGLGETAVLNKKLFIKTLFLKNGFCSKDSDTSTTTRPALDFEVNGKPVSNKLFHLLKSQLFLLRSDQYSGDCGGAYSISWGQVLSIKSPNYPLPYPIDTRCNYLIVSPVGTKISISALDLDLEQSTRNVCIDGIELRYYHLGQVGPIFCGSIGQQSQIQTIKSYRNYFMVMFRSEWGQAKVRRGFSLQFRVV